MFFKIYGPHIIGFNRAFHFGADNFDWTEIGILYGGLNLKSAHKIRMLSNQYFSSFGIFKSINSELRVIMFVTEITLSRQSNEINSAFTFFFYLHTVAWSIIKQLANNSDMTGKSSFIHSYLKIGALHLEW